MSPSVGAEVVAKMVHKGQEMRKKAISVMKFGNLCCCFVFFMIYAAQIVCVEAGKLEDDPCYTSLTAASTHIMCAEKGLTGTI